jgi:hypothetical protein
MLKRIARHRTRSALVLGVLVAGVMSITLSSAFGGGQTPTRPIAINQTDGLGNQKLVAFTYFMNFHCTHEPFDDLDRNGTPAAADPDEFQTPICHVGEQPTIDPAGKPIKETEPLYVIVPFFDADHDGQAASPGLADALKSLFGIVPDAFDPSPGVPVQCPEPGPPLTQHKGAFGTCTMHPSQLDLGPVLNQLGLVPKDAGRLPKVSSRRRTTTTSSTGRTSARSGGRSRSCSSTTRRCGPMSTARRA